MLSNVGRREEALAVASEAVAIRRRLAEENPAAYMPDLAMALNNLGATLSNVGRREEALAVASEAVAIRRRLAEENPAAYV
ncbi:tetratricopeptide repeat protein, partial [Streptomyces sp. NPDC057966]|uniref:tetratricopeptide repeat protein n=1 Tax=Streptomyces sp. NPDC057966 TaxID=3346292 RepID=UPI0036F09724